MKIFISWSSKSKESREFADYLKKWLPYIFTNHIEFFMSTEITKGAPGFCEIMHHLKTSDFGIICLTKANLKNSWINFETGGLLDKNPCTVLIGLNSSDLEPPIGEFQCTNLNKEDIWILIQNINEKLENPMDSQLLKDLFEKNYPELGLKINEINESLIESSRDISDENSSTILRHLPIIKCHIFQRNGIDLPEVRFLMGYIENGLPIYVKIAIEILVDGISHNFSDIPLYGGKEWWILNPMSNVNGWFPMSKSAIDSGGEIEVRINIRIKDYYGNIYDEYLPVGYVYMREQKMWFYHPSESLHATGLVYHFVGWDIIEK